ncbi:MAG: molybdopterin-dependent oxidoreductase [Bdellovibrionota bacterium]|nr:molybdopterin-dependent oxidoreductase [Bdellovibrionota bacterium]
MATRKVMKKKTSFGSCNLCEAICGLEYHVENNKVVSLKGDSLDPLSRGHICPKAYGLKDIHEDPDRLRMPMKRKGSEWDEISWEEAFDRTGHALKKLSQKYGPNSIGIYRGNPNVHNLDAMLFGTGFTKSLRTRNRFSASTVDQIPHQLVAYFMFGHQLMIPVPDLSRTSYFLILGGNPMASNGSLMTSPDFYNHAKAIQARGGKIVVIDPRITETADIADEHYFIKPGRDAVFLLGILHLIFKEGKVKIGRLKSFSKRIEKVERMSRAYELDFVSKNTGISQEEIYHIYKDLITSPTSVCYGRMGVSTQAFGSLCHWLINVINILTGNFDKEGGAMFPLPAFDIHKFTSPGGYNRWQSRVELAPEVCGEFPVGTLITEMSTMGNGQIRGLVTTAGNPVLSTPNGKTLGDLMGKLDFMASIDIYLNETTRNANIIMPPCHFLETTHYDLIFHNFAIRDTAKLVRPTIKRKKGAKTEGNIYHELQWRLEKGGLLGTLKAFYRKKIREFLTPRRIIDWSLRFGPYGFLAKGDRKKKLNLKKLLDNPHGIDLGPLKPLLPDRIFRSSKKINLAPFILLKDEKRLKKVLAAGDSEELYLIGRRHLRSNNSWMHNCSRLMKGKERCTLFMHPDDARRRDIKQGDLVRVTSSIGEVDITLEVTDKIQVGVVSIPHGWGHNKEGIRMRTAENHPGVSINDLTDDKNRDEVSGNASFSTTRVEVRAI